MVIKDISGIFSIQQRAGKKDLIGLGGGVGHVQTTSNYPVVLCWGV